jgi:hypothetical protein
MNIYECINPLRTFRVSANDTSPQPATPPPVREPPARFADRASRTEENLKNSPKLLAT